MTATLLEQPETGYVHVEEPETTDDPDKAAHIVMVPPEEDDETPQAYVLRARIEGFPIEALCGHIFVPQQNPENLAVCEECKDMFQPRKGRDLPDA